MREKWKLSTKRKIRDSESCKGGINGNGAENGRQRGGGVKGGSGEGVKN